MPKRRENTPITQELYNELKQILVQGINWEVDPTKGDVIPDALYEEIRYAVIKDFSLAGVYARGASHEEYVRIGNLGGRPRAGETPAQAYQRRALERERKKEDADLPAFADSECPGPELLWDQE